MRISDWSSDVCSSDLDLEGTAPGQADDEEVVANAAASDYCVNQDELNGFIARIAPFFKEERVVRFAQRINVHPGLVVGQLQRRLKRYDLFRTYQVKVRQFVTSSALPDGWGDRKSVVSGKGVSVRVKLGGSRIIKK